MKPAWTESQSRAIHTTGRSLLVSAAAGSGKTAVLAARCAYLVCDAPEPCDVTELLVVTFTNAAAEEMRRRIGQAIYERAGASNDPRLQRQSLLINAAQISTIHSLGQSIIRRHFHDLGIDPHFRLLDDDESRLLRSELVAKLLEDRFNDPAATDFRKLVDRYANGQPRLVGSMVLAMHAKLSSVIDPEDWLAARRAWLAEASEKPLCESQIGKAVLSDLATRLLTLADGAQRLAAALAEASGMAGYTKHVADIESTLRGWHEAFAVGTWDALAADIVGFNFERLPASKAADREIWKNRIDALKDRIRKFAGCGVFAFTQQQLRDDVRDSLWVTDQIVSLVQTFETSYTQSKRDAGTLDFADLEHLTLQLLKEPGSNPPAPSKIAREYRQQFRHVMVDEYQDVNPIQDTILTLLGPDESHFAVGDVKQSIYRFRQADPQRFIDRYKRYKQLKPAPGEVIDLQQNFRSRGPLLDILNCFFAALMTRESAEVEYSKSQRLVPGARHYGTGDGVFTGTPIEFHVLEKEPPNNKGELAGDEREALIAAVRIRQLLGLEGTPRARATNRDGSTRPIEAGDIVILLRAMRIKAEHFASILRRCGVPVQADSTSGFFATTEVGDVLSVLRLIVNRRDDLSLAAFLRSPMSGWTQVEDKLAEIRLAFPTGKCACFHQAYAHYGDELTDPLSDLICRTDADLDRWRETARNKPVADVLRQIVHDTAYLTYIAGLPDGPQRVANVNELYERAKQFGTFARPTVARFLEFLRDIEDEGDLGMPAAAGVALNAVRIMSIHKSKGLEFPVVILPDLGKAHNLRDANDRLLFDDSVGIAARMVDAEKEIHYATLATTLAASEIRRKQIAEELRVLYVAGTRAKEHLILIGSSKEGCFNAWDDAWLAHTGPLPAGEVRDASCMLDWLGAAATLVERDRPGSIQRTFHAADSIADTSQKLLQSRTADLIAGSILNMKPLTKPPAVSAPAAAAIARLEYQYPYAAATGTPAVTSVTASTKSGKVAPGGKSVTTHGVVEFKPVLELPRVVAETVLTAADLGTITHNVLQRINLRSVSDHASLERELQSLVDRRFLRPDEVPHVDRDAVLWFIASTLGRKLQTANDVRRELSITYTQPADADNQLVRGRLDAVLVETDGLTIIDYKTDNVTDATIDARTDFYRGQIDAYREHLARLARRPVKAAYLVFLKLRRIVEM